MERRLAGTDRVSSHFGFDSLDVRGGFFLRAPAPTHVLRAHRQGQEDGHERHDNAKPHESRSRESSQWGHENNPPANCAVNFTPDETDRRAKSLSVRMRIP